MRTANVKVVEEGLLVKGSFVVISSAVQVSAAISMAAERRGKNWSKFCVYSQLQVSESRFIRCKRSEVHLIHLIRLVSQTDKLIQI